MSVRIEGPPRTRTKEKLDGGRVKGVMLRAHIDWIRDHHGEMGIHRALENLSKESKEAATSPLASMWYPFSVLIELDREIISQWGDGKPEFVRELGAYSARTGLSTTYKLFKRASLHEFFERSAPLHTQFQDFGTQEFRDGGEKKVEMIHKDYACYSPIYCESALGYYHQVVELHGDEPTSIREMTCRCAGDDACTYEIVWA